MISKKLIQQSYRYTIREIRHLITKKPYFLNYPTATLCNHKCVMCYIHEIKKRDEVSVVELDKILEDPLFDNIESIGLSGGEPFMKPDLVDVVERLVIRLKRLRHLSINSNGQLPNKIKSWLPQIQEICKSKGVQFNLVFSMDGVGEVHNDVRGRKNAWEQLKASFMHTKSSHIDPTILMTIHRRNFQDVFNVFAYSLNYKMIPYFGIATIIERLGNEEAYDEFNLFNIDKYYIWEFLQNLSHDITFPINKRIWYDLLSYQLLYNVKRSASCVAKDKGVYLSDSGEVSYCGVYDKPLEEFNYNQHIDMFLDKRNDENIRNRMVEKHCNTCMHDYQSKPRFRDIINFIINEYKGPQIKKIIQGGLYRRTHSLVKKDKKANNIKKILLYGWFGTETTGDKAIYDSIIKYLENYFDESVRFSIVSSMVAYTERTLIELGLDNIDIITFDQLRNLINDYDLFVYCGGPVMGYSNLYEHYEIVNRANRLGKYTMIYGAGISPIKRKLYRNLAFSFIKQNDFIILRDKESLSLLASEYNLEPHNSCVIIDPGYIWAINQNVKKQENKHLTLGISFRVHPGEDFYSDNMNSKLKDKISSYIRVANEFILENDGRVILIPMNTFHIGGDDRKALYQISKGILRKDRVELLSGFYFPLQILESISKCDLFLGMRFHSSVFSNALLIPTVGVEYVLPKGKVTSLYNNLDLQDNLLNINDLSYDNLKSKLNHIIKNKEMIVSKLEKKNRDLYQQYYNKIDDVLKELKELNKS